MAQKTSKFPPKPKPGADTAALAAGGIEPDIEQLKRDATYYRQQYWRENARAARLQCLLDAAGDALARCKQSTDEIPF